jgi:tetratricopeptide (TPR) repeat protein
MKKDTIALCVIAGNVEHLIERFITSFQKLTPHIYVVRACGSQSPDSTLEIAEKLGAKVAVYTNRPANQEWPHVDHFGNARQQAFDMGAADGHTYLMWADTDDLIDPVSATRLQEIVEKDKFDMLYCAYRLSNNGLTPFRERVGRAGSVRWDGAVHEHMVCTVENPDTIQDDIVAVTHMPGTQRVDQPNERNIRIIESLPPEPRYQFYVCQEYEALGRRDDAVQAAMAALTAWKGDNTLLLACEAYELYVMLSNWSGDPAGKEALLREAWAIEPWRREALCFLSALYSDQNKAQESLALARMAMSLPKPDLCPWTHREGLYGWAGLYVYTCALRLNGFSKEADQLEKDHFLKQGRKITVLHPVRGRALQSAHVRKVFLERAKDPGSIEYIFIFPEDDLEAFGILGRFRHVLSPAGHLEDVGGTYVLNMNTGFAASEGRVIVGAADDIEPPIWWDEQVLTQIGDPEKPAVLGVKDGIRADQLLVTHVFTRPTPQTLGLPYGEYLSGEYRGVYSDNEFSFRAAKAGIIKPSTTTFLHHHPVGGKVATDETYSIMNSEAAYAFGKEVFERRNPDAVKLEPVA